MKKKPTEIKVKTKRGRPVNTDAKTGLTVRETEILSELSLGKTYKTIAGVFFISTETVRTHAHKIYKKLNVKSRIEAIRKTRGLN